MRKFLSFLLAFMLMVPCCGVIAQEVIETPVALCYNEDAYSIDYEFLVSDNANITNVRLELSGCFYDWNYVKTDARLYISLASANPIPKSIAVATIISDDAITVSPLSIRVNGIISNNAKCNHTETKTDALAPSVEKPGMSEGLKCTDCELVIKESEEIPATGPVVTAVSDENGNLTVCGALSDSAEANGITYLAIYDKSERMITVCDITKLNQSDFTTTVQNVNNAYKIKILRWSASGLTPLYNAVDVYIE